MNRDNSPTAAVLIIGNEILSGRTQDVNLNAIARRLEDIGIGLSEARVVADDANAIVEAVNTLRNKYTYLFTTGGIGPTHDDITTACVAQALEVPIERNQDILAMLKRTRGDNFREATGKMADYPAGADVQLIRAPDGVPPGYRIANVFVLAGVPSIMQAMLEAVLPLLAQGAPVYSESVDVMMGESAVADHLRQVQDKFPKLDIGSYPFRTDNVVGTSVVTRGTNAEDVKLAHSIILRGLEQLGAPVRAA